FLAQLVQWMFSTSNVSLIILPFGVSHSDDSGVPGYSIDRVSSGWKVNPFEGGADHMIPASIGCERPGARRSSGEPDEPFVQIGQQVVGILEADVQPNDRPRVRPLGRGAAYPRIDRSNQALGSAPAGADAEVPHAVHHRADRLALVVRQHD